MFICFNSMEFKSPILKEEMWGENIHVDAIIKQTILSAVVEV